MAYQQFAPGESHTIRGFPVFFRLKEPVGLISIWDSDGWKNPVQKERRNSAFWWSVGKVNVFSSFFELCRSPIPRHPSATKSQFARAVVHKQLWLLSPSSWLVTGPGERCVDLVRPKIMPAWRSLKSLPCSRAQGSVHSSGSSAPQAKRESVAACLTTLRTYFSRPSLHT